MEPHVPTADSLSMPMESSGSQSLADTKPRDGGDAKDGGASPGANRLKPIPKDRLRLNTYTITGTLQGELTDADDGLNSSALSFEDASRLHSSAIAMETATIQTLRNEKWHLNCKIDELKRQLDAEINEKKALSVKIDGLQTQYESKLRLLRDSTEGDARKDSLRTRELELALHHKEQQLQEAIRLSSEKQSKDTQVLQEKVAHYEKELQERVSELEAVRALHRKSEQRVMQLETGTAEKAVETSTLSQKLANAEEQLSIVRREMEERRTGAESLRAHNDRMALEYNEMKTRTQLLEDKIQSLTEQNNQLIMRNKNSQSTFEDLQEKGSQVRRSLEDKVKQYIEDNEKLKQEAVEAGRLRQEIETLKERIVALSANHVSSSVDKGLQARVAELEEQNAALKQTAESADYWKEQHTVIARDIGRYQATNAANAVSMEALEAQLAAERIKREDATSLAASRDEALGLEKRNFSSVQESLLASRKECVDLSAKCVDLEAELAKLKSVIAGFEGERKTWTALHTSYVEAKAQIEGHSVQLAGKDETIASHLKTIEMLKADKLSWDILQENYMNAKAAHDKMAEEKAEVVRELETASDKNSVYEREKLELIGTLATVSKEWEVKNEKIAAERRKETALIEKKLDELQQEVVKLTERNTLLSADKIRYEQLKKEYDEHMVTCNNKDPLGLIMGPPQPAGNNVHEVEGETDGSTLIKVRCSGGGGGMGEAERAHLQDLQDKNQLLSRLAGLHEAMEKIRYEPMGERSTWEEPPMPSGTKVMDKGPASVDKATSGIKWEGGPVDGLGWSSYYLRDRPRDVIEPLSNSPMNQRPHTAPERPRTAPETQPSGAPMAREPPPATSSNDGVSQGRTPGLGINNDGYHSGRAVTSEIERRQLHFGDDTLSASMLSSASVQGRTMQRDPWIGDGGFEPQVVTRSEIVYSPIRDTTNPSAETVTASASSFGSSIPATIVGAPPAGPPPSFIPTPSG